MRAKFQEADWVWTLMGRGGLIRRPSGTKPVIRVMAESGKADKAETVADRICVAEAEGAG